MNTILENSDTDSTNVQYRFSRPKRGSGWWAGRVLTWLVVLALVLGAAALAAGAVAKTNLTRRYPPPGQLVDVGGYKMHIYCTGQGSPTVILASGLDDFSIFWRLVQPEVARTTRVCSYDRPGLGWSEPSPLPSTSETMVKELHTLLVNADVEGPYVVVGHSFGGALARLYSHYYPDDVMGMVFVDAAPDDLFVRVPKWRNPIQQKLGLYRTLAPLGSLGLLAMASENIPDRGLPDETVAQYRAIAAATRYFQTGIAENEAFETNLDQVRAARITTFGNIPLIVVSRGIWEAMPGLSEVENQQAWQAWQEMQSELAELSPNGRQIMAEESGHSIQLDQPELVIDAIRQVVEATRY